ncbi:MAG: hypothetical protein AABZ12_10815 [Planctomycetota bacterium]
MSSSSANSPQKWVVMGVAVLGLAGTGWGLAAWWTSPPNTAALPAELTVESLKASTGDPAWAIQRFRDVMEREDLTEEQRRQAFANMREVREEGMNSRVNEYVAASSQDDKNAILDRHIDEMEKWRVAMEQVRAERDRAAGGGSGGPSGGSASGPGGGPGSGGQAGAGGSGGRSGERGPGGWGGPGGFMGQQTQQDRKERSESRDPDQMAQRVAYFSAIQSRMKERGMAPPQFGPGMRGNRGP